MKDVLADHIRKKLGGEPENLSLVLDCFEELESKKGEHLLMKGDHCKYVYFIVAGCLQVYVIDKQGNESIREFYFEDYWCTDIFGFQNQRQSEEFIKCLEDCKLLRIHFNDFQKLRTDIPAFAMFYNKLLEGSYNSTIYRVNTFTSLDALGRIQWVMEHKPIVMKRLPSKLVASYLGIQPETMTRFKSRI